MAIAHMIDGAPKAEVQPDGSVGLYAQDNSMTADPEDPYIGFLFPRATALATALRLLAAVQQGADGSGPMLPLQSIEGAIVVEPNREPYARLSLGIEGAEIPVFADRAHLARLVADLSALLAELG